MEEEARAEPMEAEEDEDDGEADDPDEARVEGKQLYQADGLS